MSSLETSNLLCFLISCKPAGRCYVFKRTHDERGAMNLDHYKSLLLAQERELIARRARTGSEQREPRDGAAGDVGDDSILDEQKEKLFAEDEANASVLDDVRLALGRIADGSLGRCLRRRSAHRREAARGSAIGRVLRPASGGARSSTGTADANSDGRVVTRGVRPASSFRDRDHQRARRHQPGLPHRCAIESPRRSAA